ncbi:MULTISPECIES: putative glycoside hydrolase [Fusobacterium]|uniref:putative glycoside hydrolase n=1 Tax=Fusobacterium TaxID=848 RepID=UPI0014769E6F|nr:MULTISPECIES: putative glycoside hydrolase [Fusobacterium]NME35632.1 hypothetical protein [Fusobacterium sp. FSA-380-WT-3A]
MINLIIIYIITILIPLNMLKVDYLYYITNYKVPVLEKFDNMKEIDEINKNLLVKVIKEKNNKVQIIYYKNFNIKIGWIDKKYISFDKQENYLEKWEDLQIDKFPQKNVLEKHLKNDVRGIYVNSYSLRNRKKLDKLIELTKDTEINTFVIDIKDESGKIICDMGEELDTLNPFARKEYYLKSPEEIIKKLKENNIYLIGRIVVFKDEVYLKSFPEEKIKLNKNKEMWVLPYSERFLNYIKFLCEEGIKLGVDEIQLDYVRFPESSNEIKNKDKLSKPKTIQQFIKKIYETTKEKNIFLNIDVFGQVGTFQDDMGLGQYWEAISGYSDYISPMMYPSHYAKNSYGVDTPDFNPYKIVYETTKDSIERNSKVDNPAVIRPWIQGFTAKWIKNYNIYTEFEINEQIKALEDLGIEEYLIWNASNEYNLISYKKERELYNLLQEKTCENIRENIYNGDIDIKTLPTYDGVLENLISDFQENKKVLD